MAAYKKRVVLISDECIFIHVSGATKETRRLLIQSEVDSDAIAFGISVLHTIAGIKEQWIEFGIGNSLECISNHLVAPAMKTV